MEYLEKLPARTIGGLSFAFGAAVLYAYAYMPWKLARAQEPLKYSWQAPILGMVLLVPGLVLLVWGDRARRWLRPADGGVPGGYALLFLLGCVVAGGLLANWVREQIVLCGYTFER